MPEIKPPVCFPFHRITSCSPHPWIRPSGSGTYPGGNASAASSTSTLSLPSPSIPGSVAAADLFFNFGLRFRTTLRGKRVCAPGEGGREGDPAHPNMAEEGRFGHRLGADGPRIVLRQLPGAAATMPLPGSISWSLELKGLFLAPFFRMTDTS